MVHLVHLTLPERGGAAPALALKKWWFSFIYLPCRWKWDIWIFRQTWRPSDESRENVRAANHSRFRTKSEKRQWCASTNAGHRKCRGSISRPLQKSRPYLFYTTSFATITRRRQRCFSSPKLNQHKKADTSLFLLFNNLRCDDDASTLIINCNDDEPFSRRKRN